jgi:N-acyl-phosphatidylethanolamine-hydrolysing phospholipase D
MPDDAHRGSRQPSTPPNALAHHTRKGYRNPWSSAAPAGVAGVARWLLWERLVDRRPRDRRRTLVAPARPELVLPRCPDGELRVTWVGHSTALLQLDGVNILTDPMWSERASPFTFAGPARWAAPGVRFDELPPIDIVLLSHDHFDHLDVPTVRRLAATHPDAVWCTPLGVAALVGRQGVAHVEELDWWQHRRVARCVVTCTPAQHFSGRSLAARGTTLWSSWSVTSSHHRVHFGGDTGYHPDFARIAAACGPFDLALLPIGAYEPRWFMRPVHMNPDEAVRAWRDITDAHPAAPPPVLVPIHWGTFKLTDEPMDEPPRRLRDLWEREGHPRDALRLLAYGETTVV